MAEMLPFLVVVLLGLLVDLTVAWSLTVSFGCPLPLAAAAGFVSGAALNFWLHSRWTFPEMGPLRRRHERVMRYLLGIALTLATRVASVSLLAALLPEKAAPAALVGGIGASFVVNYVLSRNFVFAKERHPKGPKE